MRLSRWVLVAAVLGTALAYMSDDMLNLALPSVARDLGATVTDAQWIVNAYYVALVSTVLVLGSIGDIYGHLRVFVSGLFAFSAGALVCAAAPSSLFLIAGRFGQGIGAAALLAAGLALVMRLSAESERSRAVGLFLGLVAAVPAIGPFISGSLVDLLSWRWLFLVPLVLPVAALFVTWRFVPETERASTRRPDVRGAALAFLTLTGLSVGLIGAGGGAERSVLAIAFAGAAIGAVVFVVMERRTKDPLLPLTLFRRRLFLAGNVIWLLACMASWGAVFFTAVGVQATLGQPAFVAGLTLTPIYLVMMVGSPLAGRLADVLGPRPPIVAGLVLYALGLVLLSRVGPGSSVLTDVLPGILVLAVGMTMFSAPLAAATMGDLDAADQGVGSGVNNAMSQLAGLLGIAVIPLVAGLAGVGFDDPAFAMGAQRALLFLAAVVALCVPLAYAASTSGLTSPMRRSSVSKS